jgi:Suppressor of fused protein (SUFU)
MSTPEKTESGQPIYRHQDTRQGWTPPEMVDSKGYEALEAHYAKHFGKSSGVYHEILSDLVHIDVYMYPATSQRDFHVLATIGMSALPMQVPEGAEDFQFAELLIALPKTWKLDEASLQQESHYFPIRWLKYLARMPHQYQTWLGFGHTIPNGDPPQPLAENTSLCGLVLLPPILFGEEFSPVQKENNSNVHIWAIVPLYEEEIALKLKNNVEALFEGFEKHQVSELLDLSRPNTIQPQKPKGFFGRLFGG